MSNEFYKARYDPERQADRSNVNREVFEDYIEQTSWLGPMCGLWPRRDHDGVRESARDILARRFASGEITKDHYEA